MLLNKKLKVPPKWSRMEPSDRKRRGRPTEKRVERLEAASGEIDAHTFPDKALPRPPLRAREMDWAPSVPTHPDSAFRPSDAEQLACETLTTGFAKKSGRGKKFLLPVPCALACDMDQQCLGAQL